MPDANYSHTEELSLIQRYKDTGDLQYAGALYQPYMHLVYGVCLKYLKNREESQDAVMHIFEKLTVSLLKHEVKNFKSWLYVLSKNHCLMLLRSKSHQVASRSKDISDRDMENTMLLHHSNDEPLEEDIGKLEKCIEELQNEQKRCVKLFYLESKSYKEIEHVTEYDLKKIKSYIQNGKRNLKNCMERNSE